MSKLIDNFKKSVNTGVNELSGEYLKMKTRIDKVEDTGFGVLSDRDILKRRHELFNTVLDEEDVQPASVDLHLDNLLLNLDNVSFDLTYYPYTLKPGEFILGSTIEYVTLPGDLVAQVDGKSSLGRLGIAIHITAGFIDPGFNGNITLEIKNNSNKPFTLTDGMSIGQIVFFTLTSPVKRLYGDSSRNNHYQNSHGVISSRYEE